MAINKTVVCHDRDGKLYKVEANKLTFRPSIYGILIEKNKVLLSKQWDGYDFPGGGAELHETIEQTLKREFWEETGFKVKSVKIIYVGSSFFNAIFRKKCWNCQLFYFLVKKISGELSKANLDGYERKYADLAEWIDIKKLGKIKFYNSLGNKNSLKIIEQALKEKHEK
ncbi:MAG: NUDIX domain-containing protein [Parcubacteria group bacterium]|nr:NUDIX domain-containing protein [Parcubacteria group bacterium]